MWSDGVFVRATVRGRSGLLQVCSFCFSFRVYYSAFFTRTLSFAMDEVIAVLTLFFRLIATSVKPSVIAAVVSRARSPLRASRPVLVARFVLFLSLFTCFLLLVVTHASSCLQTPVTDLAAPRTSCLDPVPCCGSTCDKALACGHRCQSRCHTGVCPPCAQLVRRTCRCGAETPQVACGDRETLCLRECTVLRSCGRHRCNTVCCPLAGLPHDCPLVCNKPLKCGTHRCTEPCHKGRCPPCLSAIFTDVSCRCGKTVLLPPQPCGTQPPPCLHPCSIPQPCGHPPHHTCHLDDKCPACPVLVSRMCDGGHELRHNVRCGASQVSCGKSCGRMLRCGLHACERSCHGGPCVKSYPSGKTCGKRCNAPRACGHKCVAQCHPGAACPDTPCTERITLYCACKRRSAEFPCGTATDVLACDEECEQAARTRAFATALGLMPSTAAAAAAAAGTTTTATAATTTGGAGAAAGQRTGVEGVAAQSGYEPELIDLARRAPHFVATVERYLAEFARARDSTEMPLPPMDSEQRKAVHTLAAHFGVHTVSRGWEAERHTVLQRTERTHIPRIPLSFFSDVLRTHALRVTGLTSAVRTADLLRPLQGAGLQARVRVLWVDDRTALVCCDAPDTLVRARQALLPVFAQISVVDAADAQSLQLEQQQQQQGKAEPESHVGDDVWNESEPAPAPEPASPQPPQTSPSASPTAAAAMTAADAQAAERQPGAWRRRVAAAMTAPAPTGIRLSRNPFDVLAAVPSDAPRDDAAAAATAATTTTTSTTADSAGAGEPWSFASLSTALPPAAAPAASDGTVRTGSDHDGWVLTTPPVAAPAVTDPSLSPDRSSGDGDARVARDTEEEWEKVELE